jgi:oligoendopeptidase F
MDKAQNKEYKTEWDFTLLYTSDFDMQIEKDIVVAEKAYATFEKKWKKDTTYTHNLKTLHKALVEFENLRNMSETSKPYLYFYLRKDVDGTNQKVKGELARIHERFTKAENRIVFFTLELAKISKDIQKQILKSKDLAHFHYFLELIWKGAKHNLTEKEEKILSLMYEPASGMWRRGVDGALSSKKVEFEGKEVPIEEALGNIFELPTKKRKELHAKVNQVFIDVAPFAEYEINAIYTKKKIEDELRGFKKSYDETLLHYQNDEKTVCNLVDTVTQNFKIAHRFYTLKAKLLNEGKLDYSARGVSIGKIKREYSFEKGCEILSSAFGKVDKKYADMFEDFVSKGQIDVYPRTGKTGGAYCLGETGFPTFVLHNYTNSYRSVNTLAHEMGHAFHSELSKSQTPLYQNYTMSVAETASTLFENFAFEEVFETLSDDEKIIALHDKINGSLSTIFRQIACFNFEKELHELVRSKGFVSKEEIAQTMNKHMQAYLGPAFDLSEDEGYFFVNWSHIRRFFYVYSYAYGELVSSALYAEYKKDKKFLTKIEQFLSAGGSKSPYQIFKDIGIDTTKPDFFLNGLKEIEKEIKTLEKLVGKK